MPLTTSWLPQYLRGVGLLDVGEPVAIEAKAGRRATFAVSRNEDVYYVKQFGPSSHDYQHWANEAGSLEQASAPTLVHADGVLRVLVTLAAGRPLVEHLADKAHAVVLAALLADTLDTLSHNPLSVDGERLKIFTLLAGTSAEAPPVLVRVRRLPGITACLRQCLDEWDRGPQTLLHGDLKLWHTFLDSDGTMRLTDWESSLRGHRFWDLGLVCASAFSRWVSTHDAGGEAELVFARAVLSRTGPSLLPWVVLGSLQLAYEGSPEIEISHKSGQLAQFAVNLASDCARAYEEFKLS